LPIKKNSLPLHSASETRLQLIENSIRQAGLPARRKALIVPLPGGVEGVGGIFERSEKIIDKIED